MTDKKRFIKAMENRGFSFSDDFYGQVDLIPSYRKTTEGHHNIISKIVIVLFSGVDTSKGKLGCVCFYFGGVQKDKYHKTSYQKEILKKAFCPKSVNEAIKTFDTWKTSSDKIIKSWKTIL